MGLINVEASRHLQAAVWVWKVTLPGVIKHCQYNVLCELASERLC